MTEVSARIRVLGGFESEPLKDVLVDLDTSHAVRVRHFRGGHVELLSLVSVDALPGVLRIDPLRYDALGEALQRPAT